MDGVPMSLGQSPAEREEYIQYHNTVSQTLSITKSLPMAESCKRWLVVGFALLLPTVLRAEEAVERTGQRHSGKFVNDKSGWFFQTGNATKLTLDRIACIRFDA